MWRPLRQSGRRHKARHGWTGRVGAALVRGNADELLPLVRAGVPGFKCFMIHSGIDGFAWVDEADLRLALERLRGTGLPLAGACGSGRPGGCGDESIECERRRLAQVFDVSCFAA